MATTLRDSHLHVEIKNQRPVELIDLTTSLLALGQAYEDFIASRGYDPIRGNVRLYIAKLESGSIIADLKAMFDQASFVLDHEEAFAAFLTNFDDIVQFFLGVRPLRDEEKPPARIDAERVAQVLEPIAKDGGSQIILTVQGDLHIHKYDSQQANTVQNRIRKQFGPQLPAVQQFQHEPMTLYQVRDDVRGRAGDRGTIERFSSRPVRLHFMNEEAKRRVLDAAYPLGTIFFVDGEVGTVGDKPAVYKIQYVHDSVDQDEIG